MKKLILLTSILALAACGGGSGGGNGGNTGVDIPDKLPSTVTADAELSNAEITGMVSEIMITADGNASGNTSRMSHHNIGGKKYTSYKLDDVDFAFADEGFGGPLRFILDKDGTGEITGFVMVGDDVDENGEKEADKVFTRNGDVFEGVVEGNAAKLKYQSLGKEMGLRYSDFGKLDISLMDGWSPVFIGGYDIKNVKDAEMPTDSSLTFDGVAVGHVVAVRDGEPDAQVLNENAQKNAKLVFDATGGTPKQTLTASFDNWYDIEYTKNGNEKGSVTFSNRKGSEAYYLMSDTDGHATMDVEGEDFRYFGDNNIPTEAVGMIQVRDCPGGRCTDWVDENAGETADEVRMNLGFGGKRN